MAGWVDPRPNDFSVEGLRARFKSLQDWLRNPEFANGVRLGDGTPPTYDDDTGVTVPPDARPVDAATFDQLDQDLSDLEADLEELNTVTLPALEDAIAESGIQRVDTLPLLPDPDAPIAVYYNVDGKLYRQNQAGTEWTAEITPDDIPEGAITEDKIADFAIAAKKFNTSTHILY